MQDSRLIARLRHGEPQALAQLWDQWKGPIWSLCRGMGTDPDQARLLLQDVYGVLPTAARGWSLDAPVCCQLSKLLWQRLAGILELQAPVGIQASPPDRTCTPARADVAARLAAVPPELRLIYFLDIFFRCPAATLAHLSGWSEQDVRKARAKVAWALVREDSVQVEAS